ncbi:MAG: hypothetical protein QOD31_2763 [Pseudonocardiales bacterium]|jgi:hypothetical protein|nr:hypothetical protein [Pseudonocardiales bacterium]
MATEDDVRRIALALPEVTEDQDTLGFAVRGKGFAWSWKERVVPKQARVERRDVLAVRVAGDGAKQELLAADPDKFFTEDHYNGFPAVLVRLAAVAPDELTELLADAWRAKAPRALVAAYDAKRS